MDEAVYSSVIEGAFTSREQAADFIRKNKQPRNKSEQMVKNNYDALIYVLEHLDEEITEDTIIQIAKLVTQSAAEVQVSGYRGGAVYVTGREGVVYTPRSRGGRGSPDDALAGGLRTKQRIAPIA